jgi:hypothetical protein
VRGSIVPTLVADWACSFIRCTKPLLFTSYPCIIYGERVSGWRE